MALRIANNIAAMNAQRWLGVSDAGMKKSLERLSSGYRINRAADDAAGLAISQSFRADIASFKVASRNTSEASSMLQVAEGAMDQIGNMLTRLKELATQGASANAGTNLDKIDAEREALVNEINRIANVTGYAGTKLIDGTFGSGVVEWGDGSGATPTDLDTVNGNQYVGAGFTAAEFSFSGDVKDITAQVYTLTTLGADMSNGIIATGDDGKVYAGTYDSDDFSLTFDKIGLTITEAAAMTTTDIAADTFTVSDIGYQAMKVDSDATVGTWTVDDATNSISLTNDTTGETQSIAVTDGSQTLEFDLLGITLNLNDGYSAGEFATQEFEVGTDASSTFQVGASNNANDQISIGIGNATASGLGVQNISLSTTVGAQSALDVIDAAINTLSDRRGDIGASQNRLSYAAANLASTIENVQAAESVIRDVDMASEMTDFTKNQILLQAGTAMLAQANMAPQQVLSLFG